MDDNLEWGTPPQGHRGRWERVVDQLATRPDEWAKVAECELATQASSIARQLRRKGSCETAIRTVGAGRFGVWARVSPAHGTVEDVRPLRALP